MNILIIEDEIKTARQLKALIENRNEGYVVAQIISSIKSALSWLQRNPTPDLIFCDIQLADGLSFDIFNMIKVESPVIFCTAYDQYALRAFEANSIDYLLKPIDERKLEQSLEKYRQFKQVFKNDERDLQNRLHQANMSMNLPYKQALLVYYQDKIIPVKTSDICFIYTAHGLVNIHTDNKAYNTNYTMEQLEAMLNPNQHFRPNRQFIVNRNVIVSAEHYFNRRLIVVTTIDTPEKVIVSKLKVSEFLRWIVY